MISKLFIKFTSKHYWLALICIIFGGSLALAFAPFNIILFSFTAPAFLYFILQKNIRTALWGAWYFGLGFYGVGVSWVYISIHVYGNTDIWLALLLTLGFVSLSTSCFVMQAWLYSKYLRQKNVWIDALAFATSWVLIELFRTVFLTGFPWLLLGNSQFSSPLIHFAPVIGVYGISFIVAYLSAILILFLHSPKNHYKKLIVSFLPLLLIGFSLGFVQWSTPIGQPLPVRLVQGNIAQSLKWNPDYLQSTLQHYQALTEQKTDAKLIVWPEGAVPDLYQNQLKYFQSLKTYLSQHQQTLITGVILTDSNGERYYNALVKLDTTPQSYQKRHLVPFGEYVPFESWLRGLINFFNIPMSSFSAGAPHQALFQVNGMTIAPFLCYEIAYPDLILSDMPQANILLTSSDDSWFGDSWAAIQQLQISQMRSIEVAREQIVVANNGYTALIDEKGTIQQVLPRNEVSVLEGKVQGLVGETPFVWLSHVELYALFLFALLLFINRRFKQSHH